MVASTPLIFPVVNAKFLFVYHDMLSYLASVRDAHREKANWNKAQGLLRSMRVIVCCMCSWYIKLTICKKSLH